MIAKDRGRGLWLSGSSWPSWSMIGRRRPAEAQQDVSQRVPGAAAGTPSQQARSPAQEQAGQPQRRSTCRASSRRRSRSIPSTRSRSSTARSSPGSSSPTSAWPAREKDPRDPDQPHADRAGPAPAEARGHGGRDRSGDRRHRPAVRHQPRGLAADPRQGARDQPGAVRPRHHLSGPRAAEALRGASPGHARRPEERLRGPVRREAAVPDDPGRQADQGHDDLGRAAARTRRLREDRPGTIDGPGSRSLGGLLAEPITRHAYPQNLSDAAFHQLVDGDPRTKTPATSPRTAISPARSRSERRSGSSSAASRSIPRTRTSASRTSASASRPTR